MQKNIWIAAKYLRLSIEDGDKAESESIVNQSILIDNYMKSTSDITIVETFKDDGFSGTDFKRPGFQAMLKAIENKEINCIIVKDLSRFGREHIDVDRYIQKVFPQLGVRFIAINDNYDSETANITDTHLVLPVKSFVNDTYCRQNSQKVRSHLSAKRNIGEYVGNYVSYGYKKCDADKSQIEIDPVAAKHVRDIFNWKMEGMSNQLIADKLNELGVLAPADYKRATGVNFKSSFQTHLTSRWSAVAIIRILKNPIYYGVLQQGKSQRINYKVKVQRALPKEEWVIFENHHEGRIMRYCPIFFPFVPVKVRFIALALWYNEGIRVYLKKITAVLQAQATKLHLRKSVYFRLFRYTQGKNVSSRLDIPLRRGYPEYRNRI